VWDAVGQAQMKDSMFAKVMSFGISAGSIVAASERILTVSGFETVGHGGKSSSGSFPPAIGLPRAIDG
jgi:hypothetical protein